MEQPPPTPSEPPPTTITTPPPTTTTPPDQQPQQLPQQPQQPPQQPQQPPQPQPQQQQQQSQPQTPPPQSTTPLPINPNTNPPKQHHPSSQPQQPINIINPPSRPPFNHPFPPFPHFSPNPSTPLPSSSIPPPQRGMALGVPAHPSPQPHTSFSSLTPPSFNSPFVPGSTTTPQVRQSITGMMGSLGPGSPFRPSGVAASHQQRPPMQNPLRPPQTGTNNQSAATQNFQDHSLLRHPSAGSPGSPAPTAPQNAQSHNQPWLSSGPQGKPPLPPQTFRPQMTPQTLQQRSHIPSQLQTSMSTSTHQPQTSSSLQSQSSSLSQQTQEQHYALPSSRVPQALAHQQQIARNRGLGNQRPFAPAAGQSNSVPSQLTVSKPPPAVEPAEPCNRIISKRSIQEIVAQIDPAERLDPEVEDILVDIADDFVESVTTFACSLAKHRKSNTLESKDILLHLERNWNMSLPGFSGDEIKCYKKPFGNDVHRERLAAIKKSIAAAETPNIKSSGGQAGGGAKGHPAKVPGLVIGSPNPKVRDT